MKTVAFYSYKGGVGRTLLVANTAQFLAMSGRRVVAIDLDLEAPGLHHKLANPEVLRRAEQGELPGAVDCLLESLGGSSTRRDLREIAIEVELSAGNSGALFLIPAGSSPSRNYWAALEKLTFSARSDRRNGGLLEAILELQARIEDELSPDFLLIDTRTGITELGGLATSLLADRVVCLTTTSAASVEGILVVAEALRSAPRLPSQEPLQIDFLVTQVTPGFGGTERITRLLDPLGDSVAVIPYDLAIADQESVPGLKPESYDRQDDPSPGTELGSAMLDWISRTFPGHEKAARKAGSKSPP